MSEGSFVPRLSESYQLKYLIMILTIFFLIRIRISLNFLLLRHFYVLYKIFFYDFFFFAAGNPNDNLCPKFVSYQSQEIQSVFGAYGIMVDYRHLSLLADYMTCRGQFDAFNRGCIAYNTSPLQKMTFETTMTFLLNSCVSGMADTLNSPSASLVLGTPVSVGTGCFDVLDSFH